MREPKELATEDVLRDGTDLRAVWDQVIVPHMRVEVQSMALSRLEARYPARLSCGDCTRRSIAIEALIEEARERVKAVFRKQNPNGEFPSS